MVSYQAKDFGFPTNTCTLPHLSLAETAEPNAGCAEEAHPAAKHAEQGDPAEPERTTKLRACREQRSQKS